MPRSSGGGSHGGGSHGGSHSSGRGGSRGGSGYRTSSTYFAGATRYAYYRHHRPVYFYSNYDPTEKLSPWRYLMLLFYVPFFFGVFSMIATAVHFPAKLKTDYNTEIIIEDRVDVIADEAGLEKTLETFLEETGIAPAVVTINNEEWQGYYSSLEDYAFSWYVNHFRDEKHWLIIYSQPQIPDVKFNDWYWEGMQGDDTVRILNDSVCRDFNNELQTYLTASSFYTVGDAIKLAFDNLNPKVMKVSVEWGFFPIIIAMTAFLIFHASLMMGITPNRIRQRKAVKCEEGAKEDKCEYCDGIYIVGTCTSCPHCNAPVKMHNPYYNEDGTRPIYLNGKEYHPGDES